MIMSYHVIPWILSTQYMESFSEQLKTSQLDPVGPPDLDPSCQMCQVKVQPVQRTWKIRKKAVTPRIARWTPGCRK